MGSRIVGPGPVLSFNRLFIEGEPRHAHLDSHHTHVKIRENGTSVDPLTVVFCQLDRDHVSWSCALQSLPQPHPPHGTKTSYVAVTLVLYFVESSHEGSAARQLVKPIRAALDAGVAQVLELDALGLDDGLLVVDTAHEALYDASWTSPHVD